MKVLVTGGAGYIGSHTLVELINSGYETVVVDNLSNSSANIIDKVEKITGVRPDFYICDVRDSMTLDKIFSQHKINACIHFAGYKAVGESVKKPLMYYGNNIGATVVLAETMMKYGVNKLVFSSSATVYGEKSKMPFDEEDMVIDCANPYAWTKAMIERILTDIAASDPNWSIALLRYFNPIGAHPSGLIGDNPKGIPNNLVPYIARVASGELEELPVFGDDYPTKDGTGVRDYIHITDLARGHVAALRYVDHHTGVEAINLGSGQGFSVYEVLHAFERACGKKLPYSVKKRRDGDIAEMCAKTEKAKRILGWQTEYGIDEMCADMWHYQQTLEKEEHNK